MNYVILKYIENIFFNISRFYLIFAVLQHISAYKNHYPD